MLEMLCSFIFKLCLSKVVNLFLSLLGLMFVEIENGPYSFQLSSFHLFQVLRLHIDDSDTTKEATGSKSDLPTVQRRGWSSLQTGIVAGAIVLTGIGVTVYLKRSKM